MFPRQQRNATMHEVESLERSNLVNSYEHHCEKITRRIKSVKSNSHYIFSSEFNTLDIRIIFSSSLIRLSFQTSFVILDLVHDLLRIILLGILFCWISLQKWKWNIWAVMVWKMLPLYIRWLLEGQQLSKKIQLISYWVEQSSNIKRPDPTA